MAAKNAPKWLNIGIGSLAGLMLWFIWQAATATPPETQSILARFYLSKLLFGHTSAAETFFTNAGKDLTRTTNPLVFLPVSLFSSVAFSILGPLPRIMLWFAIGVCLTITSIYCFESFRTIIPFGGPMILITCGYICGSLIYLESEKIERGRALAIDLQIQAEEERKRIAKDLHDETLPSLSRVMRLTDQLQEEYGESELPKDIRGRLESTVMEMRRVINDLHPAVLENLGLSAALQHLVDMMTKHTSIQATFVDESESLSFSPFVSLCVFRIAQEALNNVEKHSGASHMVLSLQKIQNTLFLSISDDGKGEVRLKPESHGLHNIMHRAKLIRGRVEWKAPEKFETGTMFVLSLPLEVSSEEKRNA